MPKRSRTIGVLTAACLMMVAVRSGYCGSTAPGTNVVDSQGNLVGPYSATDAPESFSSVARKINGIWFQLPVNQDGFIGCSSASCPPGSLNVYFSGANCTGSPYADPNVLRQTFNQNVLAVLAYKDGAARIFDNILYYPTPGPLSSETVCSTGALLGLAGNACQSFAPCFSIETSAISTFDLSTLDLVPPFTLK